MTPTTAAPTTGPGALDTETVVDLTGDGERGRAAAAAPSAAARFDELVRRLSRQSVDKHFDAYADIPWDDPDFAVDRHDPRWAQAVDDGLAATGWYQTLEPETQSELGLHLVAGFAKIGLEFENVLKRGLLEFALTLPNGDPAFRYAYHEVVEEGQHAMMFQEFVNRSGFDLAGIPRIFGPITRRIVGLGRWFPELFFMFVLGGEDPIDHKQREVLRTAEDLPPVIERIMRIHVTEEARHLSFARHYLKVRVPELSPLRRWVLSLGTPVVLGVMAQMMMRPSPQLVRNFAIPRATLREAYTRNPEHQQSTIVSLRKVRRLSRELGLINPISRRVWQVLGIWSDDD